MSSSPVNNASSAEEMTEFEKATQNAAGLLRKEQEKKDKKRAAASAATEPKEPKRQKEAKKSADAAPVPKVKKRLEIIISKEIISKEIIQAFLRILRTIKAKV